MRGDVRVDGLGAASPRRGSLLVVFLIVFIDLLGFGIVLPLLPLYAVQYALHPSGWELGLLMASFSAMQFLFAPLWGRLSDVIGRRPILLIGLSGSVVFYALFGIAAIQKSFALLFASRIGAGIAGATISTAHAYIADSTSPQARSRGMALVGMAFGLGFTFGPLLGYLAVPDGAGDPGPMPGFAAAGLSAVALVLAIFLLPESLSAESMRAAPGGPRRRWLPLADLARAARVPSICVLLSAVFFSVFSFANFETTLSLVIKGATEPPAYRFSYRAVCLTFAYIGFVLALVQGGLVRRLSGRVSEGSMAAAGAALEVVGFLWLTRAVGQAAVNQLFVALTVIVAGFAFITPSLNALISRRSDPGKQGSVMGLAQSVSSLARIVGSAVGIPLLMTRLTLPYHVATLLMGIACLMIVWASGRGRDFLSSD